MERTRELEPHCAIASDSAVEADLVRSLLEDDFKDIALHVETPEVPDPERTDQPTVLVLAFKDLAKSEHYYLGKYRNGNGDCGHGYRTVLLCTKEDAHLAYKLCHGGLFDDYVVFWPINHDPMRLLMTVYRMAGEFDRIADGRPTVAEFAAQARQVAELETILAAQLRCGQEHIENTGRAVEQAENEIATALRALPASMALAQGDLVGVSHTCEDLIAPHLRSINESLQPLSTWADNVMQVVSPQLESARELGALADRMPRAVLIVDDNEFQRRIVGSILHDEGYDPVYAVGGKHALSILKSIIPGLILLDYQMPDIDGVEVMRQLKADSRLVAVPVIMVSGKGERSFILNSHKLGAVDFIVKPFSRNTLIAKVDRVMNMSPAIGRQLPRS